jgi:hypothetical protein
MTPKEKAKELFYRYYQIVADSGYPEEKSKQCALIAVDEIINFMFLSENENVFWINYWKEVKQEIKKL